MLRSALSAGVLLALAVAGWRAAHRGPPVPMKVELLREILASKNDNDPRLDTAFNALTPDEKRGFREEYARLAPELRNERGTIVFLLGRNLSAVEDWAFLAAVAAEPRCLSLADCAKAPETPSDPASGDAVTLAYPALVALKQAERVLMNGSSLAALDVVAAGRKSKAPAAAALADRLEAKFAGVSGKEETPTRRR